MANIVRKKHTTIGRWERGKMKLSTADLQALADIYGATVPQLMGPPSAAGLIAVLDRAQEIADGLDVATLEQWLALGETLKRSQK